MERQSLLQLFAIDKSGQVRFVDEVPRGHACECFCPSCGEPVLARQGEVRQWHFAHVSGTECERAAETALHLAAKHLLLEATGMNVPEDRVNQTMTLPDGRAGTGEAIQQAGWIDFLHVDLEATLGPVRPDVVATIGETMLLVEIAVTHFVDEKKRTLLSKLGLPAIEVNLAAIQGDKWDREFLRQVVVEGTDHKTWIHPLDRNRLNSEAQKKALEAAYARPIPAPPAASTKPPRIRFWVGRRMVDVIERPFGLSVWSPYDPVLNERIKSIIRALGGRWQPRFKSWLVPVEARSYLLDELGRLSGQSPETH
ncbi:competence protein CoiA family protein [Thioalbus denitrificans]|uniref:Competence protein CoiA-like protein n=1 Tax=Thioalbus denitrificans TaxID=547122 RepID=A0A369CIK5_9GAMM|nr:competence protein CoiA family protein [Thioalbus denitrificans]RCX31684.1 competence protein CoiA-like protein [Thioalbus denitrificans]